MFRHYCFMFGLPSSRTYTRANAGNTYIRATSRKRASRRCAHRTIEINSCLRPTHKAGAECREKIGNLCAVPCFTFHHHRIRRVYFSIHTLRNRMITRRFILFGRLLRAATRLLTRTKKKNHVFTGELVVIKLFSFQLQQKLHATQYINNHSYA